MSESPSAPDASPAFPVVLGADEWRRHSYEASLPLPEGVVWGRIAEDRRTQYIVSLDPASKSPEAVVDALPGSWTATASRAGSGLWAAVQRA